jgi:cardiolipin synthase A/B
LKEILEKDIDDSVPLTLAVLNKPNPIRSFKECIAALVSYFL